MWKDIEWYEWLYQVNNKWNIKSVKKWKILVNVKSSRWYTIVCLSKEGKAKNFYVHRLICQSFLENPDNLKYINHINGVKQDNRIKNLEWCTHSYNILHAYRTWLKKWQYGSDNHMAKNIYQYDIDWNFIKKWGSIMDICRWLWVERTSISKCVNNVTEKSHWYIWKYKI